MRRLKVALLHNRPVTRGITRRRGACNVEYCERGINPRRGGLASAESDRVRVKSVAAGREEKRGGGRGG